MIHYHGLPVTPDTACLNVLDRGHAFVSFARPEQLVLAIESAKSFSVDNGSYTAWRSGNPIKDWSKYYAWVDELRRYPNFDFAVIPDVIDGTEEENDALAAEWPWQGNDKSVGAPVWHLHESIDRLKRLAAEWPRICLGSSGEYSNIRSKPWWGRMYEVMDAITDEKGRPICKIHGLRMLSIKVFERFPFSSADSTNIARSISLDSKWRGTYTPPTKAARVAVMRERIETVQAPPTWVRELAEDDSQ